MSKKSTTPPSGDQRRRHSVQFKLDAVDLSGRIGVKKAANDLGINENMLHTWVGKVREHGRDVFLPVNERSDSVAELRRLHEEVRILKMERDILKKAAAYFAKESR
jgi:transposase